MDETKPNIKVSRTMLEACHVRLEIEVPVEMVNAAYEKAVDKIRMSSRFRGFRKGKTPRALVVGRFRKEIEDEAKQNLIQDNVVAVCKQEDLLPETPPRLEKEEEVTFALNAPLRFPVVFDVAPQFQLPEYKGIEVTCEGTEVDDQSVQAAIDRFLQQRVSYEKVSRPAALGDLLKVTYHGQVTAGDTAVPETAKFLLSAEETWVPLRDPDVIPGAIKALVGAEANSERKFRAEFPADYGENSLAGKAVDYTFRVLEVHAAQLPEFNDALAKEVGAADAAQARERVRQNLQADKQRRQRDATRRQVVAALMAQVDFPIPPTVLARDTYQAFLSLCREELRRGAKEEDLKSRQQALMEQARNTARRDLRRHYLFQRIAEAEQIKVEKAEVDSTIEMMGQLQNVPPKAMQRRLAESGRLTDLVLGLRESKAIDLVASLARVTETASKKE